jgi:hypothetical protein
MILKKAPFVLILSLSLLTVRAQILRNTLMTGGGLGFQFSTDHENHVNTATFNFTPVFGSFVAKNFVLGVAPIVMYSSSSGRYQDSVVSFDIHTTALSLGLGPYARYYIKLVPKVNIFIHASPSIMATWNTYYSDPNKPTSRTISANWLLGQGLSVMLAKSVAIEVGLYYQGTYHRSAQFVNGNLLGKPGSAYVDNGMVFNVGFQVYFERNKKNEAKPTPESK